jgi:hypothetical protein
MLFSVSEQTRPQYEAFLHERSKVIQDCTEILNDACGAVSRAYRAGIAADLAVITLARHVVESLDGVCLLVAKGSVLPCFPLLRSVFDALLGVIYILKADSDNRGLAYFFSQINQDKAFFERLDPTTNRGQETRRELQGDIAGPDALTLDPLQLQQVQKHIAELQVELDDPMFRSIASAWAAKGKNDPQWYSLFEKQDDLRKLAISLNFLSGYELHYRPWCRQVHATGTIASLSSREDAITVRPIRHPDGIDKVVSSAGKLATIMAGKLWEKYDPDNVDVVPRYEDLKKRLKVLENAQAPRWNDS